MLTPLDAKSSLADQVYEQLIDSILAGTVVTGEHLVMDRLAEELGVSRTPVRDALARLVGSQPAAVRAVTMAAITNAASEADRLDAADPVSSFKANRSVHRAIVVATGNPVLVDCFDTIWNTSVVLARLPRGARRRAGSDNAASASSVASAHAELLVALDGGDPDRAAAAMLDHLHAGRHHTGY